MKNGFFQSYKTGATFSECRKYRYVLWRIWDETKPRIAFIGLNPSTADETHDDPTIKRCISFARSWGYGSYYMLNLFAYRATKPEDMKRYRDPIGPQNDEYLIKYATKHCKVTVAAWGTHGSYLDRAVQVSRLLQAHIQDHKQVICLGTTMDGSPRHPLYVRGDVIPMPYIAHES